MSHTSLVPGKTDGVAVPAGYVGESLPFTPRGTTGSTGAWVVNTTPLVTLTPGVWIIYAYATFPGNNTATVIFATVSTNNTAGTGSGGVASCVTCNAQNAAATNVPSYPMFPTQIINVNGSQALYAKSFSEDSAVDVTVSGFAVRIA